MSRTPQRIPCPDAKAEGDIIHPDLPEPIPYDTDVISPDGVHIHLWMGKHDQDGAARSLAVRVARYCRDIVSVSYSIGKPTGYWAHQNLSMEAP